MVGAFFAQHLCVVMVGDLACMPAQALLANLDCDVATLVTVVP
jgi:hypothetical protein